MLRLAARRRVPSRTTAAARRAAIPSPPSTSAPSDGGHTPALGRASQRRGRAWPAPWANRRAAALTAAGIVGVAAMAYRKVASALPCFSSKPSTTGTGRPPSVTSIGPGSVVLGNPMVDTSVNVTSARLSELGLRAGIEPRLLPAERRKEILQMATKDPNALSAAGGSAVNTAKALQWALGPGSEGACVCIGAVGDDEGHRLLESSCLKAGVTPVFQRIEGVPTGHCAVLVPESGNRCIVAVRGAYRSRVTPMPIRADHGCVWLYRHLDPKFVTNHGRPGNIAVEKAQLLYATSFLVSTPSRYEVVDYMATHAVESGKIFALNLSSAEMIKVSQIRHRILSLLPKTSLLFSNEIEARTLAQSFRQGIGESDISAIEAATEIAMRLRPGGTAAITRGKNSTILARRPSHTKSVSDVEVLEHPITEAECITKLGPVVDTNGAGDAFVGGYLAAVIKGYQAYTLDANLKQINLADIRRALQNPYKVDISQPESLFASTALSGMDSRKMYVRGPTCRQITVHLPNAHV